MSISFFIPISLIIVSGFFACLGAITGFGIGYAFGDVSIKNEKAKWTSLSSVTSALNRGINTDKLNWAFLAAIAGALVGGVIWTVYVVAAWLVITVFVLCIALVIFTLFKTYFDANTEKTVSVLKAEQRRNSARDMLEVKSYAFDRKREVDDEKRVELTQLTAAKARKEQIARQARADRRKEKALA